MAPDGPPLRIAREGVRLARGRRRCAGAGLPAAAGPILLGDARCVVCLQCFVENPARVKHIEDRPCCLARSRRRPSSPRTAALGDTTDAREETARSTFPGQLGYKGYRAQRASAAPPARHNVWASPPTGHTPSMLRTHNATAPGSSVRDTPAWHVARRQWRGGPRCQDAGITAASREARLRDAAALFKATACGPEFNNETASSRGFSDTQRTTLARSPCTTGALRCRTTVGPRRKRRHLVAPRRAVKGSGCSAQGPAIQLGDAQLSILWAAVATAGPHGSSWPESGSQKARKPVPRHCSHLQAP
jgi:hypothetical protein